MKEVCPACLAKMNENQNGFDCPECGAHYDHGEKIDVSLSQAFKVAAKRNTINHYSKKNSGRIKPTPRRMKRHSTGFYGVTRLPPRKGRPNGSWRYRSIANGLNIQRVDLNKLKEIVIESGGRWEIVNDDMAEKSLKINSEKSRG